jgi:hypothetical protein
MRSSGFRRPVMIGGAGGRTVCPFRDVRSQHSVLAARVISRLERGLNDGRFASKNRRRLVQVRRPKTCTEADARPPSAGYLRARIGTR